MGRGGSTVCPRPGRPCPSRVHAHRPRQILQRRVHAVQHLPPATMSVAPRSRASAKRSMVTEILGQIADLGFGALDPEAVVATVQATVFDLTGGAVSLTSDEIEPEDRLVHRLPDRNPEDRVAARRTRRAPGLDASTGFRASPARSTAPTTPKRTSSGCASAPHARSSLAGARTSSHIGTTSPRTATATPSSSPTRWRAAGLAPRPPPAGAASADEAQVRTLPCLAETLDALRAAVGRRRVNGWVHPCILTVRHLD